MLNTKATYHDLSLQFKNSTQDRDFYDLTEVL